MPVRAPSMPASGVAVRNTTGWLVGAAITGGSVSAVTVNGVQMASSSPATVALPPGGMITITYSSAPTWSWKTTVNGSSPIEPEPTDLTYTFGSTGLLYGAHTASGMTAYRAAVSN